MKECGSSKGRDDPLADGLACDTEQQLAYRSQRSSVIEYRYHIMFIVLRVVY